MSGGTPVGGGYMRQRHSQGYATSGDDLEDDACSRPQSFSPPSPPRARSWLEIVENVLWVASAVFIVYFGDRKSNFFYLLWHDDRIRSLCRMPLYFGMACVGVNVVIFFYTSMLSWSLRRFDEKWELLSTSALPFVTLLGLVSFCLLSFALWPIWSFLTLPLMFTLFMACMVIFPHFVMENFRSPSDSFRID
ncbi:transmembrane protein 128-like isoform X1 [Tripterygium wilfordii]|uniref:transmembrane protein 128-like isoform X1 n=1 Tax=Tripterygium wilfordii TaxID=458696 RepID=UPI0018F8223C|nr:transmembrane protein 128-like isoform X1 [Tripterygium wilfordii]